MPLIIIAGYPCCGKTSFCVKLASYLEAQGVKKVVIINEESENINKRSAYLESFTEKKTRGSLKSAVDHLLDAESFVILDSMNYIKGYRYELFCISRSLRTPHCCIWVESDDDSATQWNILRKVANVEKGYDSETYVALPETHAFIYPSYLAPFKTIILHATISKYIDILIAFDEQKLPAHIFDISFLQTTRIASPIRSSNWEESMGFPSFQGFLETGSVNFYKR